MKRRDYSAGAVSHSFWFMEFRKVVGLLNEGKSLDEIGVMNKEQNIFGSPTIARANRMFGTISSRVKMLDESFCEIFDSLDVASQKLFNLIAIMAYDTLFFDFVYEVIREKMIIGSNQLEDSDIRIFFKNKQLQNEKVAKWTDDTLRKLGSSYKTMLYEAGVIDKSKDSRMIFRPILDPVMESWLNNNDMEIYVRILSGVR